MLKARVNYFKLLFIPKKKFAYAHSITKTKRKFFLDKKRPKILNIFNLKKNGS